MRNFSRIVGALSSAGLLGATFTLAAGAGAVATAAPAIVHAPRIPANAHGMKNTWAASNWSGYAESGTGFTGVAGTWNVPSLATQQPSSTTYSAAWVGVDGFNNSNLIQTGTEQDFYNGTAHYGAWWEILPAAETPLPSSYVVKANDKMSASIYETSTTSGGIKVGRYHFGSQHVWVITIADTTAGWTFTTDQTYNGPGTSAEWVLEAPQVGGHIATLANYKINPSPSTAGDFANAGVQNGIVGSGSPSYKNAQLNLTYSNDAGVMIQNGAQVSTPSAPNAAVVGPPAVPAGEEFNIAYGSATPSAPTS